jgi:RND superfamily putative drug exporter
MLLHRLVDRPRRTLVAVVLFVLVAGVVGGPLAGKLDSSGGFVAPGAESELVEQRLQAATGMQAAPGIVLLVDAPTRARVDAVAERLERIQGVARVDTPGRAGSQALVTGTLARGDDAIAEEALEVFAGARDVTVGGAAVADVQIGETVSGDLARAELIAFPILLLLSLLFFRGRATCMPLVVGITPCSDVPRAARRQRGPRHQHLRAEPRHRLGLGWRSTTRSSRHPVPRGDGGRRPGEPAIRRTMATAGRTVASPASPWPARSSRSRCSRSSSCSRWGIAGAIVALVAAAAALVLSPALFALWGAKLARRTPPSDGGRWRRVAEAVMRRPGIVAAATAAALLAFASPALTTNWTPVDASVIPKDLSSRTVADALARDAGPGALARAHGRSTRRTARAPRWPPSPARRAHRRRRADRPARYAGDGVWQLDAIAAGDPAGPAAQRIVREVRAMDARSRSQVGGEAAEFVDQQAAIGSRLLPAARAARRADLVVLWLMTGSVVLPVKAVVMNG